MTGTLLIVGTPLGNLTDISSRAAQALRQATAIYAEDTRRSRVLLEHLAIKKPLRSLHAHNEQSRIHQIVQALAAGQDIAVLTDAGTPAVSDPGAEVVDAAHAAGFRVSPIVGPSALTAALSVAGFGGDGHAVLFVGFLPARGKQRRLALAQVTAHQGVVVLFEAPHRCKATLRQLAAAEPGRTICLCREMTKIYEEVRRATAADLLSWVDSRDILGELTLVLGPHSQPAVDVADAAVDLAIDRCKQAGLSARDTATAVAAILQVKKREVYAWCVQEPWHSSAPADG